MATNSFANWIARVPLAELPPYIRIARPSFSSSLTGKVGSGRERCLYKARNTVARPQGSVAASSEEMLGGMCIAMSPLRRIYSAKVPS